jgi:ribonuclease E
VEIRQPVEIKEAAPVVEPVAAPVVTPVAEPVDLEKTLADSGLVMVQTSSTASVVAEPAPAPKLGRPRKEKSVAQVAEGEPLQMVETQK